MKNKSIKRSVLIRVIAALSATLLFSFMITFNLIRIDRTREKADNVTALQDRAQTAECAHYKWVLNLSNALYDGTEFTGSTDHTTCILGQWLYGEAGTDDIEILDLRKQIEPLHMELHQSAISVLETLEGDPDAAHAYYRHTIQNNLGTLVGLLDQVVERGTMMSEESRQDLSNTISIMHGTSIVCLSLVLLSLGSLVFFVLNKIVKPIVRIANNIKPLQQGQLNLVIGYDSNNELGQLAHTLKYSLTVINSYVTDINSIMGKLSEGNFNIDTSARYIGDFTSIQESIESFIKTISGVLGEIGRAEHRISGHAEQLSENSQSVAQGTTEQASAVQEMYATLDTLSKSAAQNVKTSLKAKEHAQQTEEQVEVCTTRANEMVSAMENVSNTSSQIGQIIATIENIAYQTNILALNAAVEAARAGDAGKGFAVVADEVRSLANQSDQAAKATKELIDNCIDAAEKGIKIVEAVSESLQKTMKLVLQSNNDIVAITNAVDEEADAISQVTIGIEQVATVTQTNSANSEEAAALSEELFAEARLLQEQLDRFKLQDE
jgi:methyl-accepting chemotaxis protein